MRARLSGYILPWLAEAPVCTYVVLPSHRLEVGNDLERRYTVEAASRFVEEEDLRRSDELARDRYTALLPPRQALLDGGSDDHVGLLLEAERVEESVDSSLELGFVERAVGVNVSMLDRSVLLSLTPAYALVLPVPLAPISSPRFPFERASTRVGSRAAEESRRKHAEDEKGQKREESTSWVAQTITHVVKPSFAAKARVSAVVMLPMRWSCCST